MLQNPLPWLQKGCVGLVLGDRKTLCFQVKWLQRAMKGRLCAKGAAPSVFFFAAL
jgi:hypothetical protein